MVILYPQLISIISPISFFLETIWNLEKCYNMQMCALTCTPPPHTGGGTVGVRADTVHLLLYLCMLRALGFVSTHNAIPTPPNFGCLFLHVKCPHQFLAPSVLTFFAYGIRPCSNKSPVAATVFIPVGTAFSSLWSQEFLWDTSVSLDKIWWLMPAQSPSFHCTNTSLHTLGLNTLLPAPSQDHSSTIQ